MTPYDDVKLCVLYYDVMLYVQEITVLRPSWGRSNVSGGQRHSIEQLGQVGMRPKFKCSLVCT